MASLSLKLHYLRLYLPNVQFSARFVAFCHTLAIVYNLQLKIILLHTRGTNEQFEKVCTYYGTIHHNNGTIHYERAKIKAYSANIRHDMNNFQFELMIIHILFLTKSNKDVYL